MQAGKERVHGQGLVLASAGWGGSHRRAEAGGWKRRSGRTGAGDVIRAERENLGMSNRILFGIVIVLSVCVALAALNPNRQQYAQFLEASLAKALERMEEQDGAPEQKVLRDVLKAEGRRIIESVAMSRTVERNYGLLTLFETRVLDVDIRVLGIAGRFIPLEREDDMAKKLGRVVF